VKEYDKYPGDYKTSEYFNNSRCPLGHFCLPTRPPQQVQRKGEDCMPGDTYDRNGFKCDKPGIPNRRFTGFRAHPMRNGKGCGGMEIHSSVHMKISDTKMYLTVCNNCAAARYKYTGSINSGAKGKTTRFKFELLDGHCAIKHIDTGLYLSTCENCMVGNVSTGSNVALWEDSVSSRENQSLFKVISVTPEIFVIQSLATKKYLARCSKCISSSVGISDFLFAHATDGNASYAKWILEPED